MSQAKGDRSRTGSSNKKGHTRVIRSHKGDVMSHKGDQSHKGDSTKAMRQCHMYRVTGHTQGDQAHNIKYREAGSHTG